MAGIEVWEVGTKSWLSSKGGFGLIQGEELWKETEFFRAWITAEFGRSLAEVEQ